MITVFLDWSGKNWDGPMRLLDMYDPQERERLGPFLNDYRIHVISPAKLGENLILKLDTELREIMAFQKYCNSGNQLKRIIRSDRYRFNSLSEMSAELITAVAKTKTDFTNLKKEGETTINMCLGIDQICEEARREGRREMREEVRKAKAERKAALAERKTALAERKAALAERREEEARRKKAEAETRELLRKYNTLKAQLEALNQSTAAQ